jgi:hypothetical protein
MDDRRQDAGPAPDLRQIEEVKALASTKLTAETGTVVGMAGVRHGTVEHGGQRWFVCRAPQDANCARLLEVAVTLRDRHKLGADAPCLAILEPPSGKTSKLAVGNDYLHSYQAIMWNAFRVAFTLDVADRGFAPSHRTPSPKARGEFNRLIDLVDVALADDARKTDSERSFWMTPADSREAEALVRLTMDRILRKEGYQRRIDDKSPAKSKRYAGFWRRPEADGVWTKPNANTDVRHVALECKLTEEPEAPLCQVVDHLAHAMSDGNGGAVYVRLQRPGDNVTRPTPLMVALRQQLEDAWLVRYLDIPLGESMANAARTRG